jgi:hypothetical protein
MKLLQGSSRAEEDRRLFFKTQVLFYLIAAPDGHAKNYSLALVQKGLFHLTPLYDIMSAYPLFGKTSSSLNPKKQKFAMAVYGKNIQYTWNSIARRHWIETGQKVEDILQETISQFPLVIEAMPEYLLDRAPVQESTCLDSPPFFCIVFAHVVFSAVQLFMVSSIVCIYSTIQQSPPSFFLDSMIPCSYHACRGSWERCTSMIKKSPTAPLP